MTVSERLQQLQSFPATTKVVIRGYEDGYNDIIIVKSVKIKTKENAFWYDGMYEDSPDEDAIPAVDLYGENKNQD